MGCQLVHLSTKSFVMMQVLTAMQHLDWSGSLAGQNHFRFVSGAKRDCCPRSSMLQSEGVGLMVWSPLDGSFLSGEYTREGEGEGRPASFDSRRRQGARL